MRDRLSVYLNPIEKALPVPGNPVDLADHDEINVSYDDATDILCIALGPRVPADHARKVNGVIHRYRGGKLIGLTIMNISEYLKKAK